jgi:hypothetical protein
LTLASTGSGFSQLRFPDAARADDAMPSAIGRLPAPEKSRHRDEAVTVSFSLVSRETSL